MEVLIPKLSGPLPRLATSRVSLTISPDIPVIRLEVLVDTKATWRVTTSKLITSDTAGSSFDVSVKVIVVFSSTRAASGTVTATEICSL